MKISELPESTDLYEGCCMPVVTNDETKKLTYGLLKEKLQNDLDIAAAVQVDPETITGEAGTQANVENVGTEQEPVLKFTIPQGIRGERGEKGEQGEKGEAGESVITEEEKAQMILDIEDAEMKGEASLELVDLEEWTGGKTIDVRTGEIINADGWFVSEYLDVSCCNKFYNKSAVGVGGNLCWYDQDKKYIDFDSFDDTHAYWDIPDNAFYVIVTGEIDALNGMALYKNANSKISNRIGEVNNDVESIKEKLESKNLYPYEHTFKYDDSTWKIYDSSKAFLCKAGEKYAYSCEGNARALVASFTTSGAFINAYSTMTGFHQLNNLHGGIQSSGLGYIDSGYAFEIRGTEDVLLQFYTNDSESHKVQIESGTTATSYVPYIKDNATLTKDVDKVNNDLHDLSFGESAGGKNLFNKTTVTLTKYLDTSGAIKDSSAACYSDYIACDSNADYKESGVTSSGSAMCLCFYNEKKEFISSIQHSNVLNRQFTTPTNARYMRESVAIVDLETFQIEKGSTATAYEPYIMSNKQLTSVNASLDEQGLLNKFDGLWKVGYYESNGNYNTNGNVTTVTPIKVSAGDTVSVKYSGASYMTIAYFNGSTFLSRSLDKYTDVAPANATHCFVTIQKSAITPSNVGALNVYVNNEIDEVKAALDCTILLDSSKNGSTISTTDWVHVGTKITIPSNSIAYIIASRTWSSGRPNGVAICSSNTTFSGYDYAVNTSTESSLRTFTTSYCAITSESPATYYLWSKGETGKTGEKMMAIVKKL